SRRRRASVTGPGPDRSVGGSGPDGHRAASGGPEEGGDGGPAGGGGGGGGGVAGGGVGDTDPKGAGEGAEPDGRVEDQGLAVDDDLDRLARPGAQDCLRRVY